MAYRHIEAFQSDRPILEKDTKELKVVITSLTKHLNEGKQGLIEAEKMERNNIKWVEPFKCRHCLLR